MIKKNFFVIVTIFFALGAMAQQSKVPLYKNKSAPVDARISDLLKRMTMDEKIAQLSHLHGVQIYSGQELDMQKLESAAGDRGYGCVEAFKLTGPNCSRATYAIQKYMVEKTRLGIPIFTVTESLHGSVQDGSTIYPQAVALGSTFNTDLAYRMAAAISPELKAQGMKQTLSPGLDVVRDLRWGRVEESFGEDPWLVGQMGIAQVRGYLDNGISPMLKPFGPGSSPQGGLNMATEEASERTIREIHLKPYEMAVSNTNIMAVMSSYNTWNRVPNSASHFLLTELLRNEWGFRGYVYSDWNAVNFLKRFHHAAADDTEAAKMALTAGLDLEALSKCYQSLKGLVENDELDVKYVDLAVSRVLRAKFETGLFDNPFHDTTNYDKKVHTPAAIQLSREIADEAIVLLKNEKDLLPLDAKKYKSIAVIGPNADQVQFGDYTWSRNNKDGITPLAGLKNLLKNKIEINYAKGCDLVTDDSSGFADAVNIAKRSDLSIVFVGSASASLARDYSNATSGEGFDLSDLDLTGVQQNLIRSVHATGKPVVVVLVTGKPFSIPWLKENIPAIVVQWYGGERSGDAIADMLFGNTNPSAKLPFSFPQSVGHLPVFYNHLPSDKGIYKRPGAPNKPGKDYVFSSPDPLWAFGYGMSYTNFKYLGTELSDSVFHAADTVTIKVKVQNTGSRDGKEVVQLYVRDIVSSIVTPVKQLKDFKKPFIKAGETATVTLTLPVAELALFDLNMKRVVEPGDFELQIGSASDDIRLMNIIKVVDPEKSKAIKNIRKENPDSELKNENEKEEQKIITVSGYVQDVQAAPIANVKVKATRSGKEFVTKADGRFSIQAYTNDQLIFSAPGYNGATLQVKGQSSLNVILHYQ